MANRELELLKLFWERFYLIGFALIVSLILLFHIVLVHSRWFLPFLFMIPSYYFLRHLSFPLSPLRSKAIVSFAVFGALVMTLAVPGRIFVAEARGKFGRLNYPMADISNKIKAEGFQRGLIIAQDHLLGADLKLNFQDSFVITPVSRMRFFPQGTHEKVLVIWEDSGDTEIPSDIRSLSSHLDIDLSRVKVTRLATPYKYGKNYNYKVVIAMTQTNNGF